MAPLYIQVYRSIFEYIPFYFTAGQRRWGCLANRHHWRVCGRSPHAGPARDSLTAPRSPLPHVSQKIGGNRSKSEAAAPGTSWSATARSRARLEVQMLADCKIRTSANQEPVPNASSNANYRTEWTDLRHTRRSHTARTIVGTSLQARCAGRRIFEVAGFFK